MQNSNLTSQQATKTPNPDQAVLTNQMSMTDTLLSQRQAALSVPPIVNYWQALLARFEPISLAQMDDVALLDRTDTKFVLEAGQLYRALAGLNHRYRALNIEGVRLNHYQTLYFDTDDFALYRRHHAGGRNRYKVRSREYIDSHLSFLEIKHKVDKNRTIKNRIQTPGLITRLNSDTDDFMDAYFPLDPQTLEPKLWNDFYRITLVSKQRPERLTLDLNLTFSANGQRRDLPGVVIAEVKQADLDRNSDFMQQMRAMGVRPNSFSKYCIGVPLLHQIVKYNGFKPNLQLINKLMKGTGNVYRPH